jgi:tryptophanyl-tRNA synthetase
MSRINLTDSADEIAKKIRKAKTDPEPLPTELEGLNGRPEADNLIGIYAALMKTDKETVLREFGGAQFSKFKNALVELAVEKLGPIGANMTRISGDRSYIDKVLKSGTERAREIASVHLRQIKDIVGFLQS